MSLDPAAKPTAISAAAQAELFAGKRNNPSDDKRNPKNQKLDNIPNPIPLQTVAVPSGIPGVYDIKTIPASDVRAAKIQKELHQALVKPLQLPGLVPSQTRLAASATETKPIEKPIPSKRPIGKFETLIRLNTGHLINELDIFLDKNNHALNQFISSGIQLKCNYDKMKREILESREFRSLCQRRDENLELFKDLFDAGEIENLKKRYTAKIYLDMPDDLKMIKDGGLTEVKNAFATGLSGHLGEKCLIAIQFIEANLNTILIAFAAEKKLNEIMEIKKELIKIYRDLEDPANTSTPDFHKLQDKLLNYIESAQNNMKILEKILNAETLKKTN